MNNMERYHDGAPLNGYHILRRKHFYQPLTTKNVESEMNGFKSEEDYDSQISENRIYSRVPDSTEFEYEDGKQLDQHGFEGNFLAANRDSSFDNSPSYFANRDESKIYPNYDIGKNDMPFMDNAVDRGENYRDSSVDTVPMNDYYHSDDNPGTVAYENNENTQDGNEDKELFIRKYHTSYRPYFRRLQQFNDFDNGNQLSLSSNKPNAEINSEKTPFGSLNNKELKLIILNADKPSDSKSVDGINSMFLEDNLHHQFLVPAYTIKSPESKGPGNKKILIVINEELLRNGNPSPQDQTQRKITFDENYDKQSPLMENDESMYQGSVEKNQTLEHIASLFDDAIDILAALQLQKLTAASQQQTAGSQQLTGDLQTDTNSSGNRNANDNQSLMSLLEKLLFSHNLQIHDTKPVLEEVKYSVPEVFSNEYESEISQIKNDPEVLKNMLTFFKGLQEVNSKRFSNTMPKPNANMGGFSHSKVLLNLPYTIRDTSRRTFQQPQETKSFSSSSTNEKESLEIPKNKLPITPDDIEYEYDAKLKFPEDLRKQLFFTNNLKPNYYPSSKTPSSNLDEITLEDERSKMSPSDRAQMFSTRAEPKNFYNQNPQARRAQTREKIKDVLQRSDSPEDIKTIFILLNNLLKESLGDQYSVTEPLFEPISEAAKMKDYQDIDRSTTEKSKTLSQVTEKPQVGFVSGKEDLKPNNMKPIVSKRMKIKVKPGLENTPKGSRGLFYDSNPLLSGFHIVPVEDKDISPKNSYPQPTPIYKKYLKYVFSTDNDGGEESAKVYSSANTAVLFNPDTDTNDQYFSNSRSHYPAAYFVKQNLNMPMVRRLSFSHPWSVIPPIQPIPVPTLDRQDTMVYPMTSSITYPALDYNDINGDGNQLLNPTSEGIDLNPLYDLVIKLCKTLKNVIQ